MIRLMISGIKRVYIEEEEKIENFNFSIIKCAKYVIELNDFSSLLPGPKKKTRKFCYNKIDKPKRVRCTF